MRWVVDHLSLVGIIATLIVLATTLALLFWLVLGRPSRDLSQYGTTAETVRGSLGLFYGLVIAITIGSVTLRSTEASDAAGSEATAVAQLTRGIRSFPVKDRWILRAAIGEYLHAIVDDEFATMREGKSSLRASASLDDLYATYQTIQARHGAEGSMASGELSKLDAVTKTRRARLSVLPSGVPGLLRGFLFVGMVLFVGLLYPVGVSGALTRTLISGGTAAVVVFAVLLTIVLDYPFSGALRTTPHEYKLGALAAFWINPAPAAVKQDEVAKLAPETLVGEWKSDSFFSVIVFRRAGPKIHAAFRKDLGTVNGSIGKDGVFRGVWCEEPLRRPPDAGIVEFRLLKARTDDGRLYMNRRWRTGSNGHVRGGWNLTKIGTRRPIDLDQRLDDPSLLCSPRSLRTNRTRPRPSDSRMAVEPR